MKNLNSHQSMIAGTLKYGSEFRGLAFSDKVGWLETPSFILSILWVKLLSGKIICNNAFDSPGCWMYNVSSTSLRREKYKLYIQTSTSCSFETNAG